MMRNIEEIRKNAPKTASHYYVVMFLGLIYIKYINNHPYYMNESTGNWDKCNNYFEAKPL